MRGVRSVDIELETNCVRASCELVITGGAVEQTLAIESLRAKPLIMLPNLELSVRDFVRRTSLSAISGVPHTIPIASELRKQMQLRVVRDIRFVYRKVVPVLAVVAGFSVLVALALRRRVLLPVKIVWLAVASAIAVVTRIVMLAYIDVTAFPAANALYLSPAFPFFLMLIVLGTYVGFVAAMAQYRGKWRVDHAE